MIRDQVEKQLKAANWAVEDMELSPLAVAQLGAYWGGTIAVWPRQLQYATNSTVRRCSRHWYGRPGIRLTGLYASFVVVDSIMERSLAWRRQLLVEVHMVRVWRIISAVPSPRVTVLSHIRVDTGLPRLRRGMFVD